MAYDVFRCLMAVFIVGDDFRKKICRYVCGYSSYAETIFRSVDRSGACTTGLERSLQILFTRRSAPVALRTHDRYGLQFYFCYADYMLVLYNNVTVFRTISIRRVVEF